MSVLHIKKLVDDIDGTDAETTIHFTWDGTSMVIDLNAANAKKFKADMQPWVDAARREGKAPPKKKSHSAAPVNIDGEQERAIRKWAQGRDQNELRQLARSTGMEVADRGRLSLATLTAAFNAGNPPRVKKVSGGPADVVDKVKQTDIFSAAGA